MLQTRFYCELIEIVFATLFQVASARNLQRSFWIEFSISFLSEFWCVVVRQNHNRSEKMNQNVSRRHVLVNNEPITSEAQGVSGYYFSNRKCRSARSKTLARCQSWDFRSQIPSNPVEFIKKTMQKKVFMTLGQNLANVQTFEFGKQWILDQNRLWLDSKACTSETIDQIDPKTFFTLELSIRR